MGFAGDGGGRAPEGVVVDWRGALLAPPVWGITFLKKGEAVLLGTAAMGDAVEMTAWAVAICEKGRRSRATGTKGEGGCSFGLREAENEAVHCFRDAFGLYPLYYVFRPGEFFAFAADVEPLLALPGVGRRLNRLKAAVYLGGPGIDSLDNEMTFFEDVKRLPPGHHLIATPEKLTIRRYVDYSGLEEFENLSTQELSEELLARLRRAVGRNRNGAGLLLSGGLKSAAIAALAGEPKLPCWSFVPVDAPGWNWPDDPRPALAALRRQHELEWHPVGWEEWGMREDDGYYPAMRQQPIWFHIREDEMAAMAGAERAGLSALMTGTGAQWLPIFRRPAALGWSVLRRGDWRAIAFDAHHNRRRSAREIARLVRNDLLAPLLPARVRRSAGIDPWAGRGARRAKPLVSLVRDTFSKETGMTDWLNDHLRRLTRDFRENAYREMARGQLQLHAENWALLGRQHGLEFRYPFLDAEVVDFCFRLPARYYFDGDPQRVLRDAMAGLLPDEIRLRPRRLAAIVDWPFRKLKLHPLQRGRLAGLERHPLLSTMVDLGPVYRALDQFPGEAALQQALASGGLAAAGELVSPGGVITTVEYFRYFAQFLDRNGFR